MPTDDASLPSEPSRQGSDQAAAHPGRFTTADGVVNDGLLDRPVNLRRVSAAESEALHAEARFLARMQHPGLPCVYEFVRDEAGAALVMPMVVGQSLSAAVAARASGVHLAAIANPTACALTVIAVCDALVAAHRRGVVHGAIAVDIITLGDDGQVLIEGWSQAMRVQQRPKTASGATPDLHVDVRALGASLFTVLVGEAPPLSADGRLAPLQSVAGIPLALHTIIRKAMSSSATDGYPSVAEMRADLGRYVAGQAPLEAHAGPSELSQRLRAAGAILLLVLVVVGVVIAFNWRSLNTFATWGVPLIEEDFSNEGWKTRWGSRGRWQQRDGRLVSASDYETALIFKQRLSPPVAIEYTGRFNSDVHPGDLSVWWCEDNAFALRPDEDIDNARAWWVQAGAYSNSWCTIWQTPARLRSQVNALVLKPDRDYRFRVEIESDRLRMWIDGDLVLEHHELVPIGTGTVGLFTWDPGKQFDDVRIWQKEVPELVSPLTVGDEALRAGRYGDAADSYARVAASHKGRPLGVEALYFQGLAQHRQGSVALARKTWQSMPDGLLRQRADCFGLDDLIDEGDMINALDRFTTWWRERPLVHDILRQRWQVCGQRLRKLRPMRSADMEAWIKLRDATFADDRASRWLVAEMFNSMSRWDETIRRFPDEYRVVSMALSALGRSDELLAAPWALPFERNSARAGMGDLEGLLASTDISQGQRADILCKSGRAAEAVLITPYPAQLYLGGDLDAMLASNALGRQANGALLALGRYEEAAGAGVPGSPLSGKDPRAMILLGRLDEAEQFKSEIDPHSYRLFEHLVAGRFEEAQKLREILTFNSNRFASTPWFGQGPGLVLIDMALGRADVRDLRRTLEAGIATSNGWGGRYALVCAATLDPAKEAAVMVMSQRTEATAWMHVARALRAELAGDRAATLLAWRAYAALPPIDRLLEGHGPSVEMETFAAWRIAMLAKNPLP